MTALGRWVHLREGREVNLHKDVSGRAYFVTRGKRSYVADSDRFGREAVWFRIDQPRRKLWKDPHNEVGGIVYPDTIFWTKEWKSWTLLYVDADGNQRGEARYAHTKADLWLTVRDETTEYYPDRKTHAPGPNRTVEGNPTSVLCGAMFYLSLPRRDVADKADLATCLDCLAILKGNANAAPVER